MENNKNNNTPVKDNDVKEETLIVGSNGFWARLSSGYANQMVDEGGVPPQLSPFDYQYKSDDITIWSPFFSPEETPTNMLMKMLTEMIINWYPDNLDGMKKTLGEFKEAVLSLSIEPPSVEVNNEQLELPYNNVNESVENIVA